MWGSSPLGGKGLFDFVCSVKKCERACLFLTMQSYNFAEGVVAVFGVFDGFCVNCVVFYRLIRFLAR